MMAPAHKILITTLTALCLSTATAQDTHVTSPEAGTLHTLIDRPNQVTTLTVHGSIDATDIYFITSSMPDLTALDLSHAQIKTYDGPAIAPAHESPIASNTIPPYAFMGCPATTIILPESTQVIGYAAFAASPITQLTIPEGVTEIQACSFTSSAITSITVPQSVTTIGDRAFARCPHLTSATIQGPITTLPQAVFSGCTALQHLSLPPALRTIGPEALQCTALSSIDLSYCMSLHTIGDWAFAQSSRLSTVLLPESVRHIGTGAFMADSSLTTLTLSAALAGIPEFMLCGTDRLPAVTLPAATDSIGTYAMAGMKALSAINATAPASVPKLGSDVWKYVDKQRVTLSVPQRLADQYITADQWQDFNINITSDTDPITADDHHPPLTITRNGRQLIIKAPDTIMQMYLYDCAGTLTLQTSPAADTARLDISALPHNIYILQCHMANHHTATIKIII